MCEGEHDERIDSSAKEVQFVWLIVVFLWIYDECNIQVTQIGPVFCNWIKNRNVSY